jgi:excinuclease UvrABC nuclease subunit
MVYNSINLDNFIFEQFDFWTAFNSVWWIYMILDLNWKVLYVWKTNDLKERHSSHHKQDCFNRGKAKYILIHRETSEWRRDLIEKYFIGKYQPTCNTVWIT